MDVEVGSNLYRNTDGMIEIEGIPQIQVALKPSTGCTARELCPVRCGRESDSEAQRQHSDDQREARLRRDEDSEKSSAHTSGHGKRHLTDRL